MTSTPTVTDAAPDWLLQALADEPDTGSVAVEGAEIAWRAWGMPGEEGVVLVHGGAAHAHWWDHVAPLLVEDRRRVVALDLSGHGDSDHRDRYDMDTWAIEVPAVAEAAGIAGAPVVVGHSLGGIVALRTAALASARIRSAVVVDSPLREPTPEEAAARKGRAFGPLRLYPTREHAIARFRPVPDQPVLRDAAAHVAAHSVREHAEGWTWKFDPRLFGLDAPASWAPIPAHVPVTLVRGERGMLPRGLGQTVRDILPSDPVMIEIPDAGHHIMLDQPLSLVAVLRTLLAADTSGVAASPSSSGITASASTPQQGSQA